MFRGNRASLTSSLLRALPVQPGPSGHTPDSQPGPGPSCTPPRPCPASTTAPLVLCPAALPSRLQATDSHHSGHCSDTNTSGLPENANQSLSPTSDHFQTLHSTWHSQKWPLFGAHISALSALRGGRLSSASPRHPQGLEWLWCTAGSL